MMFRFGVAMLAVLLAGTDALSQDSLKETLLSQEKKLFEAIQTKDKSTLRSMFAEEAFSVTPGSGRQTGAEKLRDLERMTIDSYRLSEVKAVPVSADVGILTYKFTWSGSLNGETMPDKTVFATVTWVRRNGQWKSIFYQETSIKK